MKKGMDEWMNNDTNLFAPGLAKPTRFLPLSKDFLSSSSSSVDRKASFGNSSNSLPSLLGLDEILCRRLCTEPARAAAEASGVLERPAPGHQVSRLCKWTGREEKC